ncbi:MAG: amidohydrolase family protein, partial [Xanthomonadaceae bacterium]|nr:amidohydrolase family protein [Xanthomonadaceae bacterium]
MLRALPILILLSTAAHAATPAPAAEVLLLRADRVIVDPRQPPRGPSTLVVRGDRLVSVLDGLDATPALAEGESAREIDLRGRTVLPGLVDSHVHLTGEPATPWWRDAIDTPEQAAISGVRNAALTVRAGFTTVRDLGGNRQAPHALRDAIAAGTVPGPRMLVAGQSISIVGGHGDANGFNPEATAVLSGGNICTGADQCAQRVREMSRAGADVIKLAATGGVLSQQNRGLDQHFSGAELKAIVDTAHLLGLKVAAHAHGPRGIEAAARAGVDSIDHGTYIDARGVEAMLASKTFLVPTLSPTIAYRERIGSGAYTAIVEAKIRQRLAATGKNIAAARKAGIRIAFGTDAGVSDHGRNAEEFPLMVQYGGMSARDALASATVEAADLLGLGDEIGTLAPGKSADVIAVEGDPLADVAALQQVRFVL